MVGLFDRLVVTKVDVMVSTNKDSGGTKSIMSKSLNHLLFTLFNCNIKPKLN